MTLLHYVAFYVACQPFLDNGNIERCKVTKIFQEIQNRKKKNIGILQKNVIAISVPTCSSFVIITYSYSLFSLNMVQSRAKNVIKCIKSRARNVIFYS